MDRSPVVIVGMGGSGTRVVARILRGAGLYLGTNTNGVKEDALEFAEFVYRWTPPYLAGITDESEMAREHAACVAAHCEGMSDPKAPWGWKLAPDAHLLPFLSQRFPDIRVIHVIRDGRDIAFGESGAKTHTVRLGRAVLDGDPTPVIRGTPAWKGPTSPERQARMWTAVNEAIANWPGRCLLVRLEDLVADPGGEIATLCEFARVPNDASLRRLVEPANIGRWRSRDVSNVERLIAPQLERFGYQPRATQVIASSGA